MSTLFVCRNALRPVTARHPILLLPITLRTQLTRQFGGIALPPSWNRTITPNSVSQLHARVLQFSHGRIDALRNTYFQDSVAQRRPRPPSGSGRGSGGGGLGPWASLRRFINGISPNTIFYGILGLNGLVFGAWYFAQESFKNFRDPSLYLFMRRNFTTSWDNMRSGRIWTLLTACFSHADPTHALMNGLTFFFMGPPVIALLGNTAFLTLYLGGGLACSAASLLWNSVIHRQNYSSHGASGSIYAVLAFFACAFPKTKFLVFFVLPVPAWLCVGGFFAWDVYSSISQRKTTTDSAGHVGGMLGGVLFYLRLRTRARFL